MFLLFQFLESIKFIKRIQTSGDYSLFFFIERILLLIETNDFSLGFLLRYLSPFLLIPKRFSFSFKGFLFENFRYSINLTNIAGLALTNILGILYIFNVARSDILSFILFTTSIRGYVSFTGFSYCITKGNKTTIVIFG
jgi:ABC-type xylose transport system permease subunit